MANLRRLSAEVRAHAGVRAKRDLRHVAEIIGGDGDDAALLAPAADGVGVVAAEAILPSLVRSQPRVAGIAGVVAVVNDVAATGGRASAILDTVVGPQEIVRETLHGVRAAADRYGVPIVGGHTTVTDDAVGLSTFAIGLASRPLRAANARPGDELVLVTCLDGQLVHGPDGAVIFSHLRGTRGQRAALDVDVMPQLAEAGIAWAARDISMPGLAGSLLQFLESGGGGLGCTLAVDRVPVPDGVTLEEWLAAFPSFGFLVAGDAAAICAHVGRAGLTAAAVGRFDDGARLCLAAGSETVEVWNLAREPLAGLADST